MYNDKVMKSARIDDVCLGKTTQGQGCSRVLDADKKVIKDLFLDLQREYAMMGRGIS